MTLLNRNNEELKVVSQHLVPNRLETVYNIEVDDFHTYHVGKLGIWVHNANCCDVHYTPSPALKNDPYHPDVVNKRVGDTRVYFNTVRKVEIEVSPGICKKMDVDLQPTLNRISNGQRDSRYAQDGTTYRK